MGRKVVCRYCKEKSQSDNAYHVIHVTSTGREHKWYYCCENHFRLEEREKWLWNQILLGIDYMIGYKCIAKSKTKMIKDILNNGYTREELYNCMLEMKNPIVDALEFRKDITNEYQRLCYIFSILRNSIRDITIENRKNKNSETLESQDDLVDIPDDVITNKPVSKPVKKTLMDIIKAGGINE